MWAHTYETMDLVYCKQADHFERIAQFRFFQVADRGIRGNHVVLPDLVQ
jgi:hypothetical protein